jgi:hypothetical protein
MINTEYPAYSPVISIDENALFFTSRRLRADSSNFTLTDNETGGYYEDIYVSYKNREGEWQEAELLNINTNVHSATVNVSPDGQTLYIYQDEGGDGDIYESKLVGETWTEPVKMGESINSTAWETHIAVTADGQTAYFISNRKGGEGGRDIWRTRILPNGEWGKPENLGPTLNTPYDEDAVFISPDERTLYFSSEGHTSIGGFDVFYSFLQEDGTWGEPENLGYPINTTDNDVFFVISADGKRGYFSSVRDEGYGEKDIYIISLPEPQAVQLALLKGVIIPAEGEKLPDNLTVMVTNLGTGESSVFTPRARDGSFVAILPPCYDYEVEYLIGDNRVGTDAFKIDCDQTYQEVEKELTLSPLVLSDQGETIMVSTTKGEGKPAEFIEYFGYNQKDVEQQHDLFTDFMTKVKTLASTKEQVNIRILGSASQVPTRSFSSNQELADRRAETTKARLLEYAKEMDIPAEKLKFTRVEGKVQGPDYAGDASAAQDKYRKYQYVQINAE